MIKQWLEKERKFLIKQSDLESKYFNSPDKVNYLQAYLGKDNVIVNWVVDELIPDLYRRMEWEVISTIRIRKQWNKYVLAIKWERLASWTKEIEVDITLDTFNLFLSKSTEVVEKDRLIVKINDKLKAEIDFYWWRFQWVISIEVEFDDRYSWEMIEQIVLDRFPWAIAAYSNCLTAWAMAAAKSLNDFIITIKNGGVNNEIIELLERIAK